MIVTMQSNGRSITGVNVGATNVRRHFRTKSQPIDLELGHLRIRCDLPPSFWSDRPEISDPRLCAWLQNRWSGAAQRGAAVALEMVQIGDSYRLTLAQTSRVPGLSCKPTWTS